MRDVILEFLIGHSEGGDNQKGGEESLFRPSIAERVSPQGEI